jgi:hypothetical protein
MPVLQTLASASAKSLGQVKNTSKNYLVSVTSTEDGDRYVNKTIFHLDPIFEDGTNSTASRTANNIAIPDMVLTVSGRPFTGTFGPLSDLGYSLAIQRYSNVGWGANTTAGAPSVIYSGTHNRWDLGSGDFTIEFWMFVNRLDIARANANAHILSSGTFGSANGTNFSISLLANNQIRFFNNALGPVTTSATNAFTLNNWHHVLITRSGNTITMYVDGKATGSTSGSVTGSTTYGGNTTLAFNRLLDDSPINSSAFKGFISGCRIIKGQALVSGNFTPSTVPITDTVIGHTGVNVAGSITGTATTWFTSHGSMSSFSGDGIEPQGRFLEPVITAFTPFYKDTAANANVKARTYSIYNDGTTRLSYVETTSNVSLFRFDRAFTIEGWCYMSSNAASVGAVFELGQYTDGILFRPTTGAGDLWINNTNRGEANSVVHLNQWYHYAVTRDNANIANLYINGRRILSATFAGNINTTGAPLRIGDARHTTGQTAFAHHSQVRVVRGDAVYTGNFIPPILGPLQLDGANSAASYTSTANVNTTFPGSNTVLLLHFDNPDIIDRSGNMSISIVGDARPKRFGPLDNTVNSVFVNGSSGSRVEVKAAGNAIPLPIEWMSNASSLVGRIDFWVYPLSLTTGLPFNTAESILSVGQTLLNVGIYNRNLSLFVAQNTTSNSFITGSRIVPEYQWTHVSVILSDRDGATNARILQDGIEVANGNVSRMNWAHTTSGNALLIGTEFSNQANSGFNGYVSDLRITYGDERREELTVPTAPYPHHYSGLAANIISSATGNITSSQSEVLIVAGGGGGGATNAANTSSIHATGAGGGGILHTTSLSLQKGTYTVVVGAGGARSQYGVDTTAFSEATVGRPRRSTATNGSNSYIITPGNVTYTAIGGGRGTGSDTGTPADGGSGGGGNAFSNIFGFSNQNSIPPFIGYGNNGNNGNIFSSGRIVVSGGGGGAGAPGGNNFNIAGFTGTGPFTPGAGGDGRAFFTDGLDIPIYYGGGGAGSSVNGAGTVRLYGLQPGGQGGGAYTRNTETYFYLTQFDGEPNSGGGGAGFTGINNNSVAGGAGGSGVVIFRYSDQYPRAISTTGRVIYRQRKGSHIYKFLSSGTITF